MEVREHEESRVGHVDVLLPLLHRGHEAHDLALARITGDGSAATQRLARL